MLQKIIAPTMDSSGNSINVQWYIKNNGPGTLFSANIKDQIFISLNPLYNPIGNIDLLQKNYNTGELAPGDSSLQQAIVKLPEGFSGNYYIYIYTDSTNVVFENNKENNNITRNSGTYKYCVISLAGFTE
ncbi:MAG: hypothetical protein IPL42_09615 [Saprospiraceae bacterium]|nr:hypothetical protein [Saprospiraceae bacterium]